MTTLNRNKKIVLAVMIAFVGLIVVDSLLSKHTDPIKALASNREASDLTEAYWAKAAKEQPDLFNQALQYCKAHSDKPNCVAVNAARFDAGDIQK